MNKPPRISVEPAKGLSEEERAVEQRAIENVQDRLPELVETYRKKYGTEISTDNARDIVSSDYAESPEAATRWSRATQRPAAALANHLYDEAIRNCDPSKLPVVIMTAGGPGAGKTTALRNLPEPARDSQFVYDSNLGSRRSSVEKIEAALNTRERSADRLCHPGARGSHGERCSAAGDGRRTRGRPRCTCAHVPRLGREHEISRKTVQRRTPSPDRGVG